MSSINEDMILKFQANVPILFKDVFAIKCPTLKQIAEIGHSTFLKYIDVLLITKPVLEKTEENKNFLEVIKSFSDFQYLLFLIAIDKEVNQTFKMSFKFFTGENVFFSMNPPQIIVGDLKNKYLLNEEEYEEFRTIIKKMLCLDNGEDITINSSDSDRVRALKQKLKKNHALVEKAKKKNKQASKENRLEFSDLVGSLAISVDGLNLINIWDLTYYSFQDQLKRMGWYEKYNTNLQASLAGAKIKEKDLKHWMRSFYDDDNND